MLCMVCTPSSVAQFLVKNQSSKGETTSSGEQFTGEATGEPKPSNKIRNMASKLNKIKASDSKKRKSPACR